MTPLVHLIAKHDDRKGRHYYRRLGTATAHRLRCKTLNLTQMADATMVHPLVYLARPESRPA